MNRPIHLGISPCPNDLFAFHGLLEDRVDTHGLEFEIELADVEELNRRLLAGEFDVAKGSFHAALLASDRLGVLPSGSALGFGNGPLLLAREGGGGPPGPSSRVLGPGEHTTATLLYRLFHPEGAEPRQVLFSEIMGALQRGEADFGLCIHEGRFTFAERGLVRVEDLGRRWERETGAPLPLGGILARRALPAPVLRAVQAVIRSSLAYGEAHRGEALGTVGAHAQELSERVQAAHVDLYVNDDTHHLGPDGRRALGELGRRALAAGLAPFDRPPLVVVGEERLFHLQGEGGSGSGGSTWWPPTPGEEGFVHLSFAHQLPGTLAVHFSGAHRVCLLEVRATSCGDALRLEASRGGERFPHLHRPLNPQEVVRTWELDPEGGGWRLPRLDDDPDLDEPPGRPVP